MKLEVYQQLLPHLSSLNCDGTTEALTDVQKLFPEIKFETLISIHSQLVQVKTKHTFYHHLRPAMVAEYAKRFDREVKETPYQPILLQMAKEAEVSPAMLARLMLDFKLQAQASEQNDQAVPKSKVTQLLRETHLIEDPVLAYQIQMCNVCDTCYGPYVESIKHSVGIECEFLLVMKLKENKISFLNEDDMRLKGYDKTPDVKLEVPIAWNGFIINWIESKASFGDQTSHYNYMKEQYLSYANRFGSGLVIYWYGFIDELSTSCEEHGIYLADHFPTNFIRFEPLKLVP